MDGLTRILTKCAGGGDPQVQALQTAAQMAKGPAGVALPTIPEKPEAQVVDDKALQAANKEVDSKKKEIDNLRHQLQEAKLDVLKIQMKSDLADQQTKMRESLQKEQTQMFEKLRQEQKELDKRQLEFKMEEARHKSDMAAAESAHQAKLDKSVAAHDVQIAENKAKSLIDLANQSAKQYSSMMEQARKHSDAYFADKSKQYDAAHPAIGPALQSRIDASLNAISRLGNPYTKAASVIDPEQQRLFDARSNFLWGNKNVTALDPNKVGIEGILQPLRDYLVKDLPDDSLAIDDWAMRRANIQYILNNLSNAGVRSYGSIIDRVMQDAMQSGDYRAASALRTLIDLANPDEDDAAGIAAQEKYYGPLKSGLQSVIRGLDNKILGYTNRNAGRMKGTGPDADQARYAQTTYERRNTRPFDPGAVLGNTVQELIPFAHWKGTYNPELPSVYDQMAGNDMGKIDDEGNFKYDNPAPKWKVPFFDWEFGYDIYGLNTALRSINSYADINQRRQALGLDHITFDNGQFIDTRTGNPASPTDVALMRDLVRESGEYPSTNLHLADVGKDLGNVALNTVMWSPSLGFKFAGNTARKMVRPLTSRLPSWAGKMGSGAANIGGVWAAEEGAEAALTWPVNSAQSKVSKDPIWTTPVQYPQQQQPRQPVQPSNSQAYTSVRQNPVGQQNTSRIPATQRLASNTPNYSSYSGLHSGTTNLHRNTYNVKQATAGAPAKPSAFELDNGALWKNPATIRSSADSTKSLFATNPVFGLLSGIIPQNLLSPNVPLMFNKYPAWDENKIAMQYSKMFRPFNAPASMLSEQLKNQYARQHGLLT